MKSTKFTPEILQEIKERTSIVEVVRNTVPLKLKGRDWWGCCPFHGEKTSSFHVREEQGYYHCFGCGAHGNVFDFVKETRGGSFPEAVEYLAGVAGVQLQRVEVDPAQEKRRNDGLKALERTNVFYQRNLQNEPLEYLLKRGMTEETIKTFGLGYAPDAWSETGDALKNEGFSPAVLAETGSVIEKDGGKGQYDRFRGRVMFPIHNLKDEVIAFGGRVIGAGEPKYLNSPETAYFNKSYNLYNLNRARPFIQQNKQALIVEGYMDAVALWQYGVQVAVAPMGTAITEDQVRLLWRYNDAPVSCLDGDEAGRNAATRLAKRILPHLVPGKTIRFMWMPDGEDPDSFVQKFGTEAFYDLMKQTSSIDDVLWSDISKGLDLKEADGRATVDGRIGDILKEIKNETVRKHVGKVLRDKLWQSGRRKKITNKSVLNNRLNELAKPTKKDGMARTLLALVLREPEVLEVVQEKFSELSFENQTHTALQKLLFKKMVTGGVEKQAWESYLDTRGMREVAEQLCKDTFVDALIEQADSIEILWNDRWHEWKDRNLLRDNSRQAVENELSWEQMRQQWNSMRQKRTAADS